MRISGFPKKAALLASLAALGVALPLVSSQATEPMRLDAVQLDSVTAGALAGFTLLGAADARGTVNSQSSVVSRLQGSSTPSASVATGSIVSTAIGIGGVATPPAANTAVGVTDVVGQKTWVIPVSVVVVGPGFVARADALGVASVASEFPIF